jgi:hypothetical protein
MADSTFGDLQAGEYPKKGFRIGDRVVKNPATWVPNAFDRWGRGIGVGVVVEPPFPIDDLASVDVVWPAGRCFEDTAGLLPALDDQP